MFRKEIRVSLFNADILKQSPHLGVTKLRDFSEVTNHYPFNQNTRGLSQQPLHVFLDFDGVVNLPFQRYPSEEGVRRMIALRRVIESTNALTFFTSRFSPNPESVIWKNGLQHFFERSPQEGRPLSKFPFLTDASQKRLINFARRVNLDCVVDFSLGPNKIFRPGIFASRTIELLQEGKDVTVIGSGLFDRQAVATLITMLNDNNAPIASPSLHYFDTSHVFV